MAYKVKIKNKNFIGMSHGLKFEGGVSEEFDNTELYNRLLKKGYEKVDVDAEEASKKKAEEEAEAAIQKRIDEAVVKALAEAQTVDSKKKKA